MNILCMAGYEKGHDFLREAKRQGCTCVLFTSLRLKDNSAVADGEHRRNLLHAG